MWQEIGMWLLILTVIFIFGQVWFHLVEGLLSKIKSLLNSPIVVSSSLFLKKFIYSSARNTGR